MGALRQCERQPALQLVWCPVTKRHIVFLFQDNEEYQIYVDGVPVWSVKADGNKNGQVRFVV